MRNLISNGLKKIVNKSPKYPRGDRAGRILAVATVKGGVGKTTTSVNLACGLSRFEDQRVLLVDLDAQGHCAASLSAVEFDDGAKHTVSEVLLSDEELQLLDAAVSTEIDGLEVTGADPELAEAEGRIAQKIGKELRLRDALEITRTHYDWVILDCPPNKGNLTLNALVAADQVLVPTDLSPLAVQGADELIGTLVQATDRLGGDTDILGVLLTRVDKRTTSINDEVMQTIEEAWGDLVLETRIGINTALSKAQIAGKPIFEHAPRSRGAEHYEALTREIAQRLTE